MKRIFLTGLAVAALLIGGAMPASAKSNGCSKEKTEQCSKAKKHCKHKKTTLRSTYNKAKDGVVSTFNNGFFVR